MVMEGKVWAKTLLAKNEVAARAAEIVLSVFMVEVWFKRIDYGGWSTRGFWLESKGKSRSLRKLVMSIRAAHSSRTRDRYVE